MKHWTGKWIDLKITVKVGGNNSFKEANVLYFPRRINIKLIRGFHDGWWVSDKSV